MKKALVGVLATCMLISGCGSAQPDNTTNVDVKENTAQTGAAAPATETKDPVKLSITWWGSQSRHDYTTKLLDKYTELNPNVTFEGTPSGWDGYFDKLATQAAGNVMPDIIQMDYSQIATYSKNNTLADLSTFIEDGTINVENIDENIINTGKMGDKLTGMVLSSSALAFTYNPEVFKKAGVTEPDTTWTWGDFSKSMTTITEKTGLFGATKLEANNIFPYWCRQNNTKMYAEDGSKLGYEDDKLLVDFITMIKDMQDVKAIPTPDQWSQIATKGKEAEPVVTGEGAGTFDWSNFGVIASKANPNLKLVTPPGNGTKALYIKPGMFFSVAEGSKNKEEAAKFIDWFVNSKEANTIINAERGVPVSSAVREFLKPNLEKQNQNMFDYIDLVITQSSQADRPEPAGHQEVVKALSDTLNLVLYEQDTAEVAAAKFRETANAILARNTAQ